MHHELTVWPQEASPSLGLSGTRELRTGVPGGAEAQGYDGGPPGGSLQGWLFKYLFRETPQSLRLNPL